MNIEYKRYDMYSSTITFADYVDDEDDPFMEKPTKRIGSSIKRRKKKVEPPVKKEKPHVISNLGKGMASSDENNESNDYMDDEDNDDWSFSWINRNVLIVGLLLIGFLIYLFSRKKQTEQPTEFYSSNNRLLY